MGSPCCVPLSSLKYFEVFPPLMMQDSGLFSYFYTYIVTNTFIHSKNSVPKSIFFKYSN